MKTKTSALCIAALMSRANAACNGTPTIHDSGTDNVYVFAPV